MKRFIALLLIMVLLVEMLPAPVQAQELSQDSTQINSENVKIEGTNAVGDLLSESITEEQEDLADAESQYEGGYSITKLDITGDTAVVSYDSLEEATVVVAIYSEDGLQLMNSVSATVSPEENQVTLTFSGSMPDYFMASAFMLDQYDFSPLCPAYETPLYTREMQELLASTVDDYEPERVLQLEESRNTNFLVYAEETILFPSSPDCNTVTFADVENESYIIENADDTVKNLKQGDVFVCENGEDDLLIVKVADIEVDENTVTITGGEVEVEDVFSHIKLEGESDFSDATVDESAMDEDVTFLGQGEALSRDVDTWSKTYKFKINKDKDQEGQNLNMYIRGDFELALVANYRQYKTVSCEFLEITTDVKFSAAVVGEVKYSESVVGEETIKKLLQGPLSSLSVELCQFKVLIHIFEFTVAPKVFLELRGSVELRGTYSFQTVYLSEKHAGVKNSSLTSQSSDAKFEPSLKGRVRFGIEFKFTGAINLAFIKLTEVELKLKGFVEHAIADKVFDNLDNVMESDPGIIHDCIPGMCVNGTTSLGISAAVDLKFLKKSWEKTMATFEYLVPIGNFHICLQHGFGVGYCPFYLMRLSAEVLNHTEQPIEGAVISADGKENRTSAAGLAELFLPKNKYIVSASYNGSHAETTVSVDNPKKIVFRLDEDGDFEVTESAFENILSEDIADVSNAGAGGQFDSSDLEENDIRWVLSKGGTLHVYGHGGMPNFGTSSTSRAPWFNENITIRSVIVHSGITRIGSNAFFGCTELTGVSLPSSLRVIGSNAFYGCSKLSSISLPNKVRQIESAAFSNCKNLSDVSLPSRLQAIGADAFRSCTSLTEIEIPDTVTTWGHNAFSYCTGLKTVTVPVDYNVIGSVFHGCNQVEKIKYTPGATGVMGNRSDSQSSSNSRYQTMEYASREVLKRVEFSEGITAIGSQAFNGCIQLTEVILPATMQKVGNYAFAGCNSLPTIDFHEGLCDIGYCAFSGCSSLAGIELPSTLTTMDTGCFQNCTSLEKIVIPESITAIPQDAFRSCTSLTEIEIPDTVTTWGHNAFSYCTGLKTVTVPVDYNVIGSVFHGCNQVEKIKYTPGATGVMGNRSDSQSSSNSRYQTMEYASREVLKRVEFSEGITAIGSQAFNGCGKLTDVVLPSSLESIGAYAFSANTSLKELTFSGDAPAIGNNAFAKVTASMYYPGKNLTWDDSILQNYGGNLTWLEKDGEEIPDDTIPEEPPVPIPEEDSLTDESVPEEIETEAAVPEETIAETVIPEVTDPDTVPEETTADSSEPDPDTVPEDTTADSSEPDSDTVPEDTTVAPSAPDETVPEITATEETVPENTTSDDALSEEMTGETSDTVESDSEICVLENNTDSATVSGETTQEAEWVESSASAVPEDDLTYTEILSNGEPCDPTDFTYLDTLAETVSPVEKEENTEAIWTTSSEEADYGSDLAAGDRPDDIEEQVKPSEQSAYESNLPDGSDGSGQKDPAESMESAQTETAEESDDKSDLVDADIQVNAAEPEEAVWTESMEATVPTLEAIYAGEYDSETSELYTLRKAHFSGLAVGKQYVMLALQAVDSDAPVGSDNLLYITQGVSDEEGKLSFEYIQRMDTEFSYVVACGASHKDLHNGLVIFPEMYADGTSRVISPRVTYEGKTLTEGKDYCLAGTVGYCEPGDYICYVRGIRDYTGLVECKYHVKEYKMVQQIQLDVEKVQLLPGESAVLNAEVLPVDATDNTIIWSSSDESVAKVDQTGRITAVTEGNAMITATAGDGSGVSASCALTVSLKTELMILSQPVDCAGALNSQASFTIAVNKEDVSYQWYYSTNNGETWLKSGSTGSDTDTLTVQIKEYRLGQLYRCEVTDSEGNVLTSDSATMMLPPSTIEIVSHPADVYGRSAETIPITVEATGEGLTYRWYYSNNAGKDWDVSWSEGYNTETLYPVLRTYNSGRLFKCLITDANGNKEWTEAAMMALDSSDIVITTQPVSYEGAVNDLTTFTVAAEGVNLEYSWYVSQNNGETWARSYNTGYNTPELQVRLHAYRTGFQYKCQITSGGVTVKETDVVTISLRPSTAKITKQPLNAGAEENQYVTFHVEATGNALQYQWEYSNNGGESWGNSTAADAMTDTFRVQVRQYRDGYRYRCKITDDSGRSIYSDTVTLRMGAMPGITSQPANHTGAAGETAVFTVEATGENLSYQWEYSNNGGATWSSSGASGCKTNRLSIGLAAHRNGQMYRCVITNEYGSVISDAATMTVS